MTLTTRDNYQQLLTVVIILLVFGQIVLFSATGVLGLNRHGSEFYYLARQGPMALFGLLIMFGVSRIKYQLWQKLAPLLLLIVVGLVAATLFSPYAKVIQGTRRWLDLGPIHFQPAEFAKIAVSAYGAYLFSLYYEKQKPLLGILIRAIPIPILMGCILKQPDLGSTVLLGCVLFGMFFIAGTRPKYILGLVSVGSVLFVLSLIYSPYRKRRVLAFLNPWEDPQGNGFQTIQSFLSFHSGKLFGVGLGNGNSKLFFLPEVHTDFIFTVVGEELGFIGALLLLAGFLYFSYLVLSAVKHAPDLFGRYLALGLSVALIFQVCVNLGGVTGLLPVKGLPLPFLSWGRSALLVNLAMVGILLNVLRQSGIMQRN